MQHNSRLAISAIIVSLLVLAAGSAWAKPVTLIIGAKAIFLNTAPVVDKDEVYVPLTALKAIGASATEDGKPKNNEQKLRIKPASGDEFSCNARIISGNAMVPILDIADELGVVTQWRNDKNTLSIRARLDDVSFDGSKLKVKTSFPLGCTLVQSSWTTIEKKLILDIPGLDIPRLADDKVKNDTNVPIRLGMREDGETGRIVLDLPKTVKTHIDSPARTREIAISVSPSLKDTPKPPENATMPENTPPPVPAKISKISHRVRSSNAVDVSITADQQVKPKTYMLRNPDQFIVEIANAELDMKPEDVEIERSIVTRMRISRFNDTTVRAVLDLTRPAAFDIEQDKNGKLNLSLELPRRAGGLLAGKTIVVDPGHGGELPGARGIGCLEKDVNLAVALRVEKLLKSAGAIVLMTRKTDVDIPLAERPALACNHSADLFVSIHHNAMGKPNTGVSGTETFYHAYDSSSRALAHCIQSEVVAANGLKDRGVKSDYQMYPGSGFLVLRGCTMPATLVEVAFLDHAGDAACARDSAFQQKVAEAIVRGIKLYIEGNPLTPPRRPVIKLEEEPSDSSDKTPTTAQKPAGSASESLIPKGRVK